jgi:hypothetical protein
LFTHAYSSEQHLIEPKPILPHYPMNAFLRWQRHMRSRPRLVAAALITLALFAARLADLVSR